MRLNNANATEREWFNTFRKRNPKLAVALLTANSANKLKDVIVASGYGLDKANEAVDTARKQVKSNPASDNLATRAARVAVIGALLLGAKNTKKKKSVEEKQKESIINQYNQKKKDKMKEDQKKKKVGQKSNLPFWRRNK
nr:putative ORF1 [Marmot picobirnavirus]